MPMTLEQLLAEVQATIAQKEAEAKPATPLKDILAHLESHGNANLIEIREALRMLLENLIEKEAAPASPDGDTTAKQKVVKGA